MENPLLLSSLYLAKLEWVLFVENERTKYPASIPRVLLFSNKLLVVVYEYTVNRK